MSSKPNGKSSKVDKKAAYLIIGLTLVLSVLLVAVMLPEGIWNPGSSSPTDAPQQTDLQPDKVYERWLASGMVVAVSMEYPDFQDLEIFIASQVAFSDKAQSKGAYIRFTSGGEEVVLHSDALAGERTEKGSRDLYTAQIGFASFDEVAAGGVDFDSMQKLTMEELTELIQQSMLVSIYSH